MKKNLPFIIVYVLAVAVTVVNTVFLVKSSVFYDINDLPKGELVETVKSPDNKSELNIYKIKNNIGVAVRGELNNSGKKTNVFWQTGIEETQALWQDNSVVEINGVLIDVLDGGTYDSRRGVSLFQEGAIEGEENTDNE